MTSRARLLAALHGGVPDRLPVTTHHVMPSFLDGCLGGVSYPEFFNRYGLDEIRWVTATRPDTDAGERYDPSQDKLGFLEPHRIVSDDWRIEKEPIPHPEYITTRYRFITPAGTLTTVIQENEHTAWVAERLVKEKSDIDLIGCYATSPKCDVEAVASEKALLGERGIVRGMVCGFDVYGQPGTWQDAACLYGIEALIYETYDDPEWTHAFLRILQARKKPYIISLAGAGYDLIELGGGDASSTVISPRLFDRFVAPYDAELIDLAHEAGQRIVYHTCGGMMPLLERIADMGPDAMETFTPPAMGGDSNLAEAKRRIGDRVCMIGGFDQFHFFSGCSPEETRAEVRRCFEAAGAGGGYILCPSDHFFQADLPLLNAFAEEARRCRYDATEAYPPEWR